LSKKWWLENVKPFVTFQNPKQREMMDRLNDRADKWKRTRIVAGFRIKLNTLFGRK
jgi:hypothetical protein